MPLQIKDFGDEKVINGTYGSIWIDDIYICALKKFSAKVKIDYGDVVRPRDMWDGRKATKYSGEGELTTEKIDSLGLDLMHDAISKGKTPICKILGELADPDAFGAERVMFKNVTFDEMNIFDFEHAKLGEDNLKFKFRHYELYDRIQ